MRLHFPRSLYGPHESTWWTFARNVSTTAQFSNPKFVSKAVSMTTCTHSSFGLQGIASPAERLRLETAIHERSIMMGDPVEAALFAVLLPAMGVFEK
jgi:hypothetical protein